MEAPCERGIIIGYIAGKSRFMRSRFVRQFASIVGMLAILMTAFAPAISQALVVRDPGHDVTEWRCSSATHSAHPAHNLGALDACGYCSFIAHFPAAPPSATSPQCVFAVYAVAYSGHFNSTAPFAPVAAAQPRAPPLTA